MLEGKNRSMEIRAGLLVLGAVILIVVGSLWVVRGFSFPAGQSVYRVEMESSGGVRPGDRVRVAGIEVGRIESVRLRPGSPLPVLFGVALGGDLRVSTAAKARIASEGLLGSNYLEIDLGPEEAPRLPEGGTIRGSGVPGLEATLDSVESLTTRTHELLDQTSAVLDSLSSRLGPLLDQANVLLDDDSLAAIGGTFEGLDQLIAENRPVLSGLLTRADRLVASLEISAQELPEMSQQLDQLIGGLSAAVGPNGERLTSLLEATEATMDSAGESLDTLAENRELVEATLQDLEATVANFRAFSRTVRNRPSALLRDYREPDRRPGDGGRGGRQ